jgi:hypothetical protein
MEARLSETFSKADLLIMIVNQLLLCHPNHFAYHRSADLSTNFPRLLR